MHGGAHGQHDVRDVLADAGLIGNFHVRRDGRNGRAGTERHRRRAEQLGEHDLRAALTAAELGVDREEHEHVHEAHDVVDNERAAVVGDQLRAVSRHQIGKEAEEADRGVVGDELHGLHDAACDILEHQRGLCLGAAVHLDAEAEQHRRNDQRQDGLTAQQLHEVGLGKEVDDHVTEAQRIADLAFRDGVVTIHEREDAADDVHDDTGDSGSDQERCDGHTHDLTGALDTFHIGDGRCDGAEHHRHHHTEHHVDEQCTQEFDLFAEVRGERAHETAGDDAGEHEDQESVSLKERLGTVCLGHKCNTPSV